MATIEVTKDVFLRCISLVYGLAFTSLFVQILGLYGDNGILPVRLVVRKVPANWNDFASQATLLRFLPLVGYDFETGMLLICLCGWLIAFLASVWRCTRHKVTYFLLWSFYLSLFHVGQTFLWFQWDILLLEVGFLAMFLAPVPCFMISSWFHNHDKIIFWLLRWLLFRLMFASGVVKLTSGCPTWWGLTALSYHYETQCLPTPLAWYFHQLPEWFHKFSTASTFIVEIFIPILFFSPFASHRIFAALTQVLLMVMIVVTGNYNFFNWLTIVLCLSVMDDDFLVNWCGRRLDRQSHKSANWIKVSQWLAHFFVGFSLAYITLCLFSIRLNFTTLEVDSRINFTFKDFENFLCLVVPFTIFLGALSLSWEILSAVIWLPPEIAGTTKKAICRVGCVLFGIGAVFMFSISLVPYTRIEPSTQDWLPVQFKQWNQLTASSFRLTSSYGLFRRMTGVGGRPEVIIEGSNFLGAGWKEYEFLYKPGNISLMPQFVAPHQPRLDWQMWFAALRSYDYQPWFLNLVYRLLTNQSEVLDLIRTNPFSEEPPKYIRAKLYHYHYTSKSSASELYSDLNWWRRKAIREYMVPKSMSSPEMIVVARRLQMNDDVQPSSKWCQVVRYLISVLLSSVPGDGFTCCIAYVITCFAAISAGPLIRLMK